MHITSRRRLRTTAATFGHTHTPAGIEITRDRLRLARMVLLGMEIAPCTR